MSTILYNVVISVTLYVTGFVKRWSDSGLFPYANKQNFITFHSLYQSTFFYYQNNVVLLMENCRHMKAMIQKLQCFEVQKKIVQILCVKKVPFTNPVTYFKSMILGQFFYGFVPGKSHILIKCCTFKDIHFAIG